MYFAMYFGRILDVFWIDVYMYIGFILDVICFVFLMYFSVFWMYFDIYFGFNLLYILLCMPSYLIIILRLHK